MIEIRAMRQSEAEKVRKLGKNIFEWFESLFIPKPKDCYVALENKEIIGAILYKYLTIADQKIGYVDYIFVDKAYQGKGIGSKLIDHCLGIMKKEACDGYSAIVRDDNVGSWKMFINKGLKRVELNNLITQFGVLGMLRLTFKTLFNFATGMDFYLKLEDDDFSPEKKNSIFQAFKYLIFTALLLLPLFIYGFEKAFSIIGAAVLILVIRMAFGYFGTLFSNENWYFRVCNGGYFIPIIVSFFGGIFLISGNWYPKVYRKNEDFKRALGLTALSQWTSLLLIILLTRTQLAEFSLFRTMSNIAEPFILISIIPFYPFASFGGERLFSWNRFFYIIIFILSLSIVFIY